MSEIRVAVKIDDDPPVKGGMVMGAPNGVPGPLDGSGKLPAGQVPATGGSDPTALHAANNLSDVANAPAALAALAGAPLASPALTGSPTAPTKTALDNSTKLATTAYADSAVGVETSARSAAIAALLSRTAARAVGQDELVVNVQDHGALGDGVTDDTTAVQSAATLACTLKAKLVFPRGTYMINPGAVNASGTSKALVCLTTGIEVVIERRATVKVISSTTQFVTVFGADLTTTDMSGLWIHGGGTIDGNSAARIAAHVVPNPTTACVGIGRVNKGSDIKVTGLRFTNFDSIWCVAFSSSGAGNMSNVEVSHCSFDNLGTVTAADAHDFSCIYIDAIGMSVHHNEFWQAAPGAQTFVTNYGSRTAIELHGSGQSCHDNKTYGLQWGGNLWTSYNCWLDTDQTGSKNATGISWHDNQFLHCAVGVQLGAGSNGGTMYGLSGVHVHHNTITIDPSIWNVNTGGGLLLSGILSAFGAATGSMSSVTIDRNIIRITPNNTAMNAFSYSVSPQATASHISVVLTGTNVTVPTDWTIAHNTLAGSLQDAIHLLAVAFTGLTIEGNKIRDCHLVTGGTGYPVYVATPNAGSTNTIIQTMIARNQAIDDQSSTNQPYGYGAATMSGAVVFFDARNSGSFEILDNNAFCANTSQIQPAQGGTSSPCSPGPRLRGVLFGASFTQPTGAYARGSTVTLLSQLNVGEPTAAVYHQTGDQAGNASGSSWQRQPIFSGVVSKTANYTALNGDVVLADPTGGAFAVTTPTAVAGATFTVNNVGSANAVTITPATGTVNITSLATGVKATFVCNGTNWYG